MAKPKKPRRFASFRERLQHEEMELQRERKRRIFAAIEQAPPGTICDQCVTKKFSMWCSACTAKIERYAGV